MPLIIYEGVTLRTCDREAYDESVTSVRPITLWTIVISYCYGFHVANCGVSIVAHLCHRSQINNKSTAELLARTSQANMADLRRHRVRWLGHAACKPNDVMVKQLHSIPGQPRPMGRPHLTWMDTAMHDMGILGHMLLIDLPRDWANLALYRDVWRVVVSQC